MTAYIAYVSVRASENSWQILGNSGRKSGKTGTRRRNFDQRTLDKVQKALKIVKQPISLETPIGHDVESSRGAFVEDELAPRRWAAIHSNLREQTRKMLITLTPREEQILPMRFGIGQKTDWRLEEVGKLFAVTRERTRQIEAKALRRLRTAERWRNPEGFVGIRFVGLDVGLHKLRIGQLDPVAELLDLTRPVVRRTARFHPHYAARQIRHKRRYLLPRQPLAQQPPPPAVNSVELKYTFCQIDPDCFNLHPWTLPLSCSMVEATILAHAGAVSETGRVHPII